MNCKETFLSAKLINQKKTQKFKSHITPGGMQSTLERIIATENPVLVDQRLQHWRKYSITHPYNDKIYVFLF